ncbi:MAG: hypothetical protein JO345_34195 [Streptosporangiaceae bacterium]|nr:hypothetical protein [Streptosporangiaceae bacterium]
MPCYRCGVRQTDPSRGSSPWRRGVRGDHLVLVCPACQASVPDWAAELDRCGGCLSTHLIRRLGQIECLDCGWTRDPAPVPGPGPVSAGSASASSDSSDSSAGASSAGAGAPAPAGAGDSASAGAGLADASATGAADAGSHDPTLADEVSRALDRVLGRH